jgi:PmbA protein
MNLEEAVLYMSEQAKKYSPDQFDILASESESSGVEVFEAKVKSTELNNSRGLGIRFFFDGKPGISYSEKLSKEAIEQTVKDAFENSKITDKMDLDLPSSAVLPSFDLELFNPELESITMNQMIDLGMEMERIALQQDSRIVNVPYLGVSKSSGKSIIYNSKSVYYTTHSNGISAGLGAVAKKDSISKMGVYSKGGKSFSIFDTEFMAKKSVERAIELLDAEPIESKTYPVVFSNRVSGGILGMFIGTFFAESIQKGQSRLAGKLNQKIASEILNLSSEPHLVGFPGSSFFDSEGVPSRKMQMIENGVLKTYLYNLETAKKEGVESTGNGSRSYGGKAGTCVFNLIVPKGESTVDDLLSRFDECLYIVKLEGSSGCSAISGEISIGVQGHLYRSGKRVQSVDRITLSTNFFDMIQNILAFSNEYNDSFSSVKIPDFLVSEVNIAG